MKQRTIIAILLTLVLTLSCLAGCAQRAASDNGAALASGGVLRLSVNPELAITYDADGNVTKVEARNDDGKAILTDYAGYEGKSTRQVVTELVAAIGKAGYFVEEIEGEKRQITIEIEPYSSLPHATFIDEVVSDVRELVSSNDWKSPVAVEGESDFGLTDYDDTDYGVTADGVTDYDDTDYGVNNDGVTDYDVTNYGVTADGASDYDSTANGVSDYKDTDYGRIDDGASNYDDTDYGPENDGASDYDSTANGASDYKDTDYGKNDDGASDYNGTNSGSGSSGSSDYDSGSSNYDNGSSNYDSGSSDYDSGSSDYDNGSSNYDSGSSDYDSGSSDDDDGSDYGQSDYDD